MELSKPPGCDVLRVVIVHIPVGFALSCALPRGIVTILIQDVPETLSRTLMSVKVLAMAEHLKIFDGGRAEVHARLEVYNAYVYRVRMSVSVLQLSPTAETSAKKRFCALTVMYLRQRTSQV